MAVQINVAANQAALVQSIQAGVQAYNQRFANQNQVNLQVNARGFSQPLGRITGDVKDFEAALAASNARVIAFGASTAILGGVLRGFRSIAEVTVEVEKNLADINRVFGLTTKELQKFSTDLFNVSKQTASSFGDASKAALEFSRQGVKAEEVLQRTADAMTLARLAGMNVNNAIEALTATVNGFQATGITTTQVLNKLVAVEQSYAVSAGDLAEALSRTGLAAQEAGVNIDQLNALVTAAQEKTARGGAVIGNALKTIFTRLQRTETLDQLEAFNIGVRDIQGNILPAVQILQNFASAYNTLADSQRSQLSEQVAGVYQVNILKAIITDLNNKQGAYAGALQKGATATNEAQVAAAKLNQTLDALLSQTSTVAQQFANNVGKVTFEPLAKYTAESFKSLFENLNEILEGEGVGSTFANGLLKGIRNVLAGPGAIGAFFVLFKLIQNSFSYLTQALPQIVGITTETQNRKNIEQAILQIMQQQGPISQALAGQMGNQAAQAQLLLQLARQQTAEYQRQQALVAALAPALSAQGVTVKGSGGLRVTRSGGYIPKEAKLQETIGAIAGGYVPGKVVQSPVGGVMNTAEQVKYMPGFAQPFINPPANSQAGRTHRRNSINRTGVDPYMNNGFIPNFAEKILSSIKEVKDGDTIAALPINPNSIDYRLASVDAPENNQKFYNEAKNLLANKYLNPAGVNILNNNIVKGKSAYFRSIFNDPDISRTLVQQGLAVPDFRYTRDTSLLTLTEKAKKSREGIWGDYTVFRDGSEFPFHPKARQYEYQKEVFFNSFKKAQDKKSIYKSKQEPGKTVLKNKDLFDSLTYFGSREAYSSGYIPNFATAELPSDYYQGFGENKKLRNSRVSSVISRIKSGLLKQADAPFTEAQARAAGWRPSDEVKQERKEGVLQRVLSSGFKRIGISGIGKLPSNTTTSQLNPFAKNFERLALEKAKQMFATNNIVFASNYEKGGKRFHGAPGNTRIDALEDNLTGPVIEMKSGDTTPDATLRTKFTQAKNELIEMWHSEKPLENIDNIVRSIGGRPEYLFYNADKEVKRGTEQILQASRGFIPNFYDDEESELGDAIGRKTGSQLGIDSSGVLNVGFMSSEFGNPLYELKSLFESGQVKKINAGEVVGPRIPNLIVNLKTLLPFIRKKQAASLSKNNIDPLKKTEFINSIFKLNELYVKYNELVNASLRYNGKPLDENVKKEILAAKNESFNAFKNLGNKKISYDLEKDALAPKFYSDLNSPKLSFTHKGLLLPILDKLDKGGEKIADRIPIFGSFVPQELIKTLIKERGKMVGGKRVSGYQSYTSNDLNKLRFAFQTMGVNEKQTSSVHLEDIYPNGLSKGFIPNFAADYINQVMNLESNMSGNKAVLDTQSGPFPFIRNSSQPNFAAAISDHGGMNKALNDSYKNQVAAGLMNKGFIPNFAPFDITGTSLQRSGGGAVSHKKINKAINDYINSIDLSTTSNKDISDALLTKLLPQFKLNQQSFNEVRRAALDYAKAQKAAAQQTQQQTQQASQGKGGLFPTFKKLGNIGSNIGKVINSPLGAMITSQLGSAIAGQFAFGDKKRYEMTENQRKMQSFANTGVTAISTGAFIGTAALGPGYGTAIGAAAGGLFAFIEATKAAKLSLSEFRDSISENAEKQTSIISDYKDNLEKLTKATESGDKNLIDKATRDLSASLSGLAAKNLTSNIQGKSVEDLDILISDINKKAAMSTNVLSATEKIGTGAKEVSFFDKFKQQAGEAIINLTNIVIDTFKFIGNGFVKIGTGIVEMFSSLLTNIKPAWENMMDFLGSSISMLGLKIQAFYNDVLSGIGFNRDAEIEQTKSAIDIYAQIYKESANKISDSIKKALGSASELAINFDIGEFSSKFLQGYGEFFGVTGQRKIQQYNMEDIIANYVKEGGAGTSAFYKRIFNLGEKGKKGQLMDEQLYNVINEIAVSQASKDRAAAIENLRSMLVDRGISGEDIDVLIYQIEKFSEKSNYKGQFILSEFKNFISSLMSVDATSKEMATTQVNAIKNFTKIRNDIDTSIRDYVQRSEMNQIAINGAIERQKVLLSERSRIAEVFGRPFESINIKQQERILDINRSYQSDLAKSSEKTTQLLDTLSKQSTYQSLESIQQLQQAFVSEDYTPEQRLQLIQQSLQATTVDKEGKAQNLINFQNASDRQKFLDLLKAESDSLDKRKAQNAEDIKTAKLIYDQEVKRAQEARDFNFQLRAGVLSLSDEADLLLGQLGRKIPSAFADGMTNALMQVAKGTQSIGDAFKDMAINFGQMLMQEVMRAAIGKVLGNVLTPMFSQTGGIVGKQRGGIIRAENGAYIPGNRTGDRNLALLEDGEYVLNREAVAAIGVNNLDGLNYGVAPRFQSGGGFGFAAQQSLIGDELNYSGNLIGSGMNTRPVSLDDYSAYAFENDPFFKNMRQKSIETEKERVNKEFQAKQKRAQLISSIVGGIGAIALGQGLGNLGSLKLSPKGVGKGVDAPPSGPINFSSNPKIMAQRGGLIGYQSGGFIPYGSRISDNVPRYMSGGMNAISNAANNKYISPNNSRMQGGGSNSTTNNTNNTNNSNINIVANVGSYNKSGQFVLGQSGNNYDSNEMIFSQNLARNIAKVADNQIQKANRYGGFNKQSYV